WPLPTMAIVAHTLALLAMTTVATVAIKVVPLDMAADSFDDQYRGCGPAMTKALPSLYNTEIQKNPLFAKVWKKADAEWRKRGSHVSPLGSPAQAVALMAYTTKDIYKDFNDAVRVAGRSRQEYQKNFHFKTLHFLLTQALVKLRHAQNGQCRHVYRGIHDVRFQARRGQKVRFGQFTSTSLSKEVAQKYGTDTIFEVYTCHGADIQGFSFYLSNREVLIPPYETFE
ncbi:NRT2 ribosyltransferase, partial [Chloropsis hardwickii]|nr:NRT2 ribosyltransferase [Chloropsis hardwickii]